MSACLNKLFVFVTVFDVSIVAVLMSLLIVVVALLLLCVLFQRRRVRRWTDRKVKQWSDRQVDQMPLRQEAVATLKTLSYHAGALWVHDNPACHNIAGKNPNFKFTDFLLI